MLNGGNKSRNNGLVEFSKIGLVHSPSGRLLTSETFQGSLNVSGLSLKRKQVWTLFTEERNPTAFLLQNHLGDFLTADNNGKVGLVNEHSSEERFLIHFDPGASGEVAIQSEASGFFLQWCDEEMRCFSKEPVWWGLRLGMHPQIHLFSVHRGFFIRSANKEGELRAVGHIPASSKFLIWLEQMPLPSVRAPSCTKEEIARLSRVALRTQSGRYLASDGSLKGSLQEATLFAVSFKPGASPVVMFQDERCEYLTVSGGGVIKAKMGAREPRREEFFAIRTPSTHVRLWAFNNKFACNKHGLTFNTTMEETEDHKSTIFQLEYVGGGNGLDMGAIVNSAATPSADSSPAVFAFDGSENTTTYLTTGLWRLRSLDGRLWQIPPTSSARLAPKDSTEHTSFEILYVPTYAEPGDSKPSTRANRLGGVVLRTAEGAVVSAKTLGAIGATDRIVDASWQPNAMEVLHMVALVNRPSVAIYSPLSCGYLAVGASRRGASGGIECSSVQSEQWFLRHLVSGAVQMFTKQGGKWQILTATANGNVNMTPSDQGPGDLDANAPATPETQFVVCLTSDQHVLLRARLSTLGGRPSFLCGSLQGSVRLDDSGNVQPGCIWQI